MRNLWDGRRCECEKEKEGRKEGIGENASGDGMEGGGGNRET